MEPSAPKARHELLSPAPVQAFVGVGGNLGNAAQTVRCAMAQLGRLPHTRVALRSPLYCSAPVDADGPDFINAVVALKTRLRPHALLRALQVIENAAGRQRPYRNAPRTLDLDILLYGTERIDTPTLTVPHPRMVDRRFVLAPLADIAPGLVTPAQLMALYDQPLRRIN